MLQNLKSRSGVGDFWLVMCAVSEGPGGFGDLMLQAPTSSDIRITIQHLRVFTLPLTLPYEEKELQTSHILS